jgi:hypothetical protein
MIGKLYHSSLPQICFYSLAGGMFVTPAPDMLSRVEELIIMKRSLLRMK